jgi:hypothetical protein
MSYRVAAVTVPDEPGDPRVLYLVPVDARGRKAGAVVVGTAPKSRADALVLGTRLKELPALGAYVPPVKRPEPVEES